VRIICLPRTATTTSHSGTPLWQRIRTSANCSAGIKGHSLEISDQLARCRYLKGRPAYCGRPSGLKIRFSPGAAIMVRAFDFGEPEHLSEKRNMPTVARSTHEFGMRPSLG
jgi:hypothetical protein